MADVLTILFREAVREFLAREFALVGKNAHEQAMCPCLAWYVEQSKDRGGLKGYWVDTEYNRHGDKVKRIRHAVAARVAGGLEAIAGHPRCRLPRAEIQTRLARYRKGQDE